jgi:MucR family transcriptional regulator, transcriptional regulator of exopolysaccharide biosynthesis
MPQVIKDYTHPVQKHFLPFTEDMNRSAVKLYFRLHSTHWVRSALAGTDVEYAGMQVHRATEDQNAAGKTAMSESMAGGTFIELTASIVSAYVSNNSVPTADLPALIGQVHSALTRVSSGHGEVPSEPPKPAISVKKSVTPDHIVCLEDGKKFKSLKRHLRTQYNMTPEQYREKWGLPPDYPMVAPNYAAARSHLAKQMGLGQQRRRRK